ncbi:hypothetical protein LSH36_795g00079 [Paralvinella palmiformis]|uniref:Apple domain-containing protein n=1 Tax=Paralvinella palmiformis TaxID=53620 RepID=A0AAD9J089_9ANNE|nr:hypothetical protein LSH36_795g00079 [Paralvinella palmiformis]
MMSTSSSLCRFQADRTVLVKLLGENMLAVYNMRLVTSALVLFMFTSSIEAAGRKWYEFQRDEKRSQNIDNGCRSFLHRGDALSIRSEVMRKIGNGATPEICKQACLEERGFICAAAQIQLPASCYITGYYLRNDYFSNHFRRVCDHGPACFKEERGMSGGFTESQSIPAYFQITEHVQSLYCMARCEQTAACVGFDLRREGKSPKCVFLDLGIFTDYTFELYIRRC